MTLRDIPTFNATLNGIATVLITAGFIFIRSGNKSAHRACMLSAATASALFLGGYVTYHALEHGLHTPFGGNGVIRTIYLTILWTHIPLAGAIAFLVPKTFSFALKGDFVRHRAWARVTFPIWYYVSVTGVLIYFFLYIWWPAPVPAPT
jgi:putative membrane protein